MQTLNLVLLTANELIEVKTRLRNLNSPQSRELFSKLYRSNRAADFCFRFRCLITLQVLVPQRSSRVQLVSAFSSLRARFKSRGGDVRNNCLSPPHVALLVCSLAIFSAEFEITVNTLMEIDKLVQLLESPVFMSLRLQLLEPQRYSRTW